MMPRNRIADAYARYATLIASQLEALDHDDLDGLAVIGLQRERLAAEIEGLELDGSDAGAVEAVRRQLRVCIDADAELRDRLERLREENAVGTRRVERWRRALKTYSRSMAGAAAIDVKF